MTFKLRPWQVEAAHAWEANGRRGVVEVVTGGGKTIFALTLLLRHLGASAKSTARIVVPTLALLDQWLDEIEQIGIARKEQLGVVRGGRASNPTARIQVGVVNSLRGIGQAPPCCMLIADEVHRYSASANATALQGAFESTLGLSATPENDFDNRFSEILVPLVGPIIFRYGLNEALTDGVLTPFRVVNTRIPLLEQEQANYSRLSARIGRSVATHGMDSPQAKALLQRRARLVATAALRVPVAVKLVEEHPGKRAIVFHESIADARAIATALTARGRSVAEYHSQVGAAIRRDNLRMFRKGVVDILVTCRSLDEGLNAPEIEIAVIAAATATSRQRIQRMGRVLRRSQGKAQATVHTVYATSPEASRLRSECERLGPRVTEVRWRELRTANE